MMSRDDLAADSAQRANSSAICKGSKSMNYNMIVLDLDGTHKQG